MTPRELHDCVKAWNQRLAVVAQNLTELQEHPSFTLVRDSAAITAMQALFQHFGLLEGTIREAEGRLATLPMLGLRRQQELQEVQRLLTGRSVVLPPIEVPLAQRGLLSQLEQEQRLTPAAVLNLMTGAFERARDAVMTADRAWQVQAAQAREVREAEQRREQELQDGLREASVLVKTIRDVRIQRLKFQAECEGRIVDWKFTDGVPETSLETLADWQQRLQQKYDAGLRDPLRIGLRRWRAEADAALQAEQQSYGAYRTALALRQELRGRLDALRAKARARGCAEEPSLLQRGQQADTLLHSRPTPLRQAQQLVAQYEAELLNRTPARAGQ